MKKFDFSKEFGNIDPKYIEEAEIPAIAITNKNPLVTSNNPFL